MNDIKSERIESITRVLERTAAWRKSLAVRFPEDGRNLRAVEILDQLTLDAAGLTDEQFQALSPYYNWASENWRAALTESTRGIGFHIRTKQFEIFLKVLLQRLSLASCVAA